MNAKTAGLRRKRNALLDERQATVHKAIKGKRGLTAAEISMDASLEAQADSLAQTIIRAEEVESDTPGPQVSVRDRGQDRPRGETFAACVLAIAGAHLMSTRDGRSITPEEYAKEVLGDRYAAAALSASTLAAGGGLIRQDISTDFVELLRAKTVVRRAGAKEWPMPKGNLTINGQSGGATATWIGEQTGVKASAPVFREVLLSAKKLRCTVPISNDLIRFAGPSAVERVLEDAQAVVSVAEDLAFLRGAGTAFTPKGLKNQGGATHASSSTVTVTSVTSETGQAITDLLAANSRMLNPYWFWAPRTTVALRNQRSGGFKSWPEIEELHQFRGYPFFETTAIPTNLISIDSEIYFTDMDDVVIGQVPMIEARVSGEASYQDSTGAVVSAFDRDETVIDIIEEVDLGVRHAGSLSLLTAVEYLP